MGPWEPPVFPPRVSEGEHGAAHRRPGGSGPGGAGARQLWRQRQRPVTGDAQGPGRWGCPPFTRVDTLCGRVRVDSNVPKHLLAFSCFTVDILSTMGWVIVDPVSVPLAE